MTSWIAIAAVTSLVVVAVLSATLLVSREVDARRAGEDPLDDDTTWFVDLPGAW